MGGEPGNDVEGKRGESKIMTARHRGVKPMVVSAASRPDPGNPQSRSERHRSWELGETQGSRLEMAQEEERKEAVGWRGQSWAHELFVSLFRKS